MENLIRRVEELEREPAGTLTALVRQEAERWVLDVDRPEPSWKKQSARAGSVC
jgi:hypothetical protein